MTNTTAQTKHRRVVLADLFEEPYRVFFPAAVAAGIWGVVLWPWFFGLGLSWYPAMAHARLMAHGFFGGFIFGFLGTAFPRLVGARPMPRLGLAVAFALYVAMVVLHGTGRVVAGDALFLALLVWYMGMAAMRFFEGEDLPPPGFILVILAFLCAVAGAVMALLGPRLGGSFAVFLLPPLYYQGFVLLPILGVGGFILPRFFDLPNTQDLPESRSPSREWIRKALAAAGVGVLILVSFFLEAAGHARLGHLLRLGTAAFYLLREVPIYRASSRGESLPNALKLAIGLLFFGILSVALFPLRRAGLMHLTLIGGFGILTLCVATRVVFGHSGHPEWLRGRRPWMTAVVVLMVVGMATRISGDYWPAIRASHYAYGAALLVAGFLLWAFVVLPLVAVTEADE